MDMQTSLFDANADQPSAWLVWKLAAVGSSFIVSGITILTMMAVH